MATFEAECEDRVWQHDPAGLAVGPPAPATSWSGSIQAEVTTFGLAVPVGWPTIPALPNSRVAVIMIVKDEEDIIGANLAWLYFVGVRRFVVMDNDSHDGTALCLRRFEYDHPEAELLIVKDPILRYMQTEKTTGLFHLARSLWPDIAWVFPLNADEFLIPQHGLAVLDDVAPGVDALTIPKAIHYRKRGEPSKPNAAFFETMAYRSPIFEVPAKIALRKNPLMSIAPGNHKISVPNRASVYDGGFKYGVYYREFPVRSFEQFLRKTRNGGRAVKAAEAYLGRAVGGIHWLEAYDHLQTGGEEKLFELYLRNWMNDPPTRFVRDRFRGLSVVMADDAALTLSPRRGMMMGG